MPITDPHHVSMLSRPRLRSRGHASRLTRNRPIAYPMRNRSVARFGDTPPRTRSERRTADEHDEPVPDEIRKELTIQADTPAGVGGAHRSRPTQGLVPHEGRRVDLRPGGEIFLEWDDMNATGIFDEIDPPNRLVYRWHPAGDDHPSTTVEFTLADADDGAATLLTVVERGFAQLPPEPPRRQHRGLDERAAELVDYLATTLKPRH